MHPTNLQWVQPTDALRIEPFLCWCIEQLAASFQSSSTNCRHPLARRSERMSEAWSAGILQVCHAAEAMVMVVVLVLAACSP
jgi:hypothetical protein